MWGSARQYTWLPVLGRLYTEVEAPADASHERRKRRELATETWDIKLQCADVPCLSNE